MKKAGVLYGITIYVKTDDDVKRLEGCNLEQKVNWFQQHALELEINDLQTKLIKAEKEIKRLKERKLWDYLKIIFNIK